MKFSCEKLLLQNAVNTASRAVAAKSSIPALEGLLLTCGGESMTVSGYNMQPGIRTKYAAEAAASGALEEAWCNGTAAVISPIGELSWGDRDYKVNDNKIGALSQKRYDELTGIQWGTKPDPFGWVCPID